MILPLLLACAEEEGLGDCPADAGADVEFEVLDTGVRGSALEEGAHENEVEVFHDHESLAAWWRTVSRHDVSGDIDFSTSQAVGLVTRNDGETGDGYFVESFQWADDQEAAIVIRLEYKCSHSSSAAPSYNIDAWITPILPVSTCHLEPERCEE